MGRHRKSVRACSSGLSAPDTSASDPTMKLLDRSSTSSRRNLRKRVGKKGAEGRNLQVGMGGWVQEGRWVGAGAERAGG